MWRKRLVPPDEASSLCKLFALWFGMRLILQRPVRRHVAGVECFGVGEENRACLSSMCYSLDQ
jgi:hypothetical protein